MQSVIPSSDYECLVIRMFYALDHVTLTIDHDLQSPSMDSTPHAIRNTRKTRKTQNTCTENMENYGKHGKLQKTQNTCTKNTENYGKPRIPLRKTQKTTENPKYLYGKHGMCFSFPVVFFSFP